MEKCYEHTTDLHMLFIDFRQAFDSVYKDGLYWYMKQKGVPDKLVRLIKMTLEDARAKVLVDGKSGEEFALTRGVRQGDALSATLFNIALQRVLEQVVDTGSIIYKSRQVCAYADDVVLISRNKQQLREMLIQVRTEGKKMGLEINEDKTKYMKMATKGERSPATNLIIGDMTFTSVQNFSYLGADVNSANKTSEEINKRIMAGNRAYYANIKLITSRSLSRATKLKLYKTLIRPVVTYGTETWNISVSDANKLRIFERKIIRRIYGGVNVNDTWRSRTNAEINDILQGEDIVRFCKGQRIRWIGHVERMAEHRVPKKIYRARMEGRRIQGRPRNRWKDEVEADLRRMGVTAWRRRAGDRAAWRDTVREAKAHIGL